MNTLEKTSTQLHLRHFSPEDEVAFISMVNDPEIKEFYAEFNDEESVTRSKFNGLNKDIAATQYWGIFNGDGVLVGFACLKRNHSIFKTLKKIEQEKSGVIDDFEFEPDEQINKREKLEKLQSPYAIDIAIHPSHRQQGIGKAGLKQVFQYAAEAGLKECYFEVREDNGKSQQLISGFNPEKVINAQQHYGHDLYRLPIVNQYATDEELKQQIKDEENAEKKKLIVKWRFLVLAIPELTPHRTLILELFEAIALKGASIDFHDKHEGCSHSNLFGHHTVNISLIPRPSPISLIWSIAHEYGHLLQRDAVGDEKTPFTYKRFLREQDAWLKAGDWLKDKTLFIYNWPDFVRFSHRRLEDYLPDRNFQADSTEPEVD